MCAATVAWRRLEGALGVAGNALAGLEHLDRRASHAHGHLGRRLLARHAAIAAGDLDVYSRRRPAPPSILRIRSPAPAVRAWLTIQFGNCLTSGGLEVGVVGALSARRADMSAANFAGGLVGGLGIVPLQPSPALRGISAILNLFRKFSKIFYPL